METKQKHKILLSNLKKYYKEDDDIGDKELIDKTITEFFVVEEYKGIRKIKEDKMMKNTKHSLVVKTLMFGGKCKHLNKNIAINFGKQIYNLI